MTNMIDSLAYICSASKTSMRIARLPGVVYVAVEERCCKDRDKDRGPEGIDCRTRHVLERLNRFVPTPRWNVNIGHVGMWSREEYCCCSRCMRLAERRCDVSFEVRGRTGPSALRSVCMEAPLGPRREFVAKLAHTTPSTSAYKPDSVLVVVTIKGGRVRLQCAVKRERRFAKARAGWVGMVWLWCRLRSEAHAKSR